MTPDPRDPATLGPLADMLRRRALADLAAHLRQEQALRDACRALDARLAEADRQASADVTLLPAAERFRDWATGQRAGLNQRLAALLARGEGLRAEAARAQGRSDALARMVRQAIAARRRVDERRLAD
jgi:hypothetical protein